MKVRKVIMKISFAVCVFLSCCGISLSTGAGVGGGCEPYGGGDQLMTSAWLDDVGPCVSLYAGSVGGGIQQPRGLVNSPLTAGDLLVADMGEKPPGDNPWFSTRKGENGRIVALRDMNDDGVIGDDEWIVLARQKGLNHGIAVHNGYLFASTSDKIYRWPYEAGQWEDLGDGELVLYNMDMTGAPGPGGGLSSPLGHSTRTLIFDKQGRLYVSVGSVGNVDGDSYRSRIRRFGNLSDPDLSAPVDFTGGEIFADGLRNEVGLAWADDKEEVLFGVENGMDNLKRSDLGGDIHNDNPAEELNAFPVDKPGMHYGYPWCFTEYELGSPKAEGRGSQWALEGQAVADDAYCKNPEKNVPPMHSMQSHSAPLGISFYGKDWKQVSECCRGLDVGAEGANETDGLTSVNTTSTTTTNSSSCEEIMAVALPCQYIGNAFVPFHGSWNRDDPTGYKVVRLAFDEDHSSVKEEEDFIWAGKDGPKWKTGMRPVDVAFGPRGEMYISSYKSGEILLVRSQTTQ